MSLFKNSVLVFVLAFVVGYTTSAQKCIAPINVGNTWGFVSTDGSYIVPAKYENINWVGPHFASISQELNGMIRVFTGDRMGYYNLNGELVVPTTYEDARDFSEDVAAVMNPRNKWGFIDKQGNIVLDYQYKEAREFRYGYGRVARSNNEWGFIDKERVWLIEPVYKKVWPMNDQVARVKTKQDGHNYVKRDGTLVLPNDVDRTYAFENGVSWFKDGKTRGLVNNKGEVIFTGDNIVGHEEFMDGKCAIENSEGLWGFVDINGNMVVDFQFEIVEYFFNGRAVAERGDTLVVIDGQGKVMTTKTYNVIKDYSGNRALCTDGIKKGSPTKWGYLDKNGNEIIKQTYKKAKPFSNGLAGVKVKGLWGFIDTVGNVVIEPKFINIGNFNNLGLARAEIDGKWGVINKKGEFMVEPIYDDIDIFSCGVAVAKEGRTAYVIEPDGKRIGTLPKHDQIRPFIEMDNTATRKTDFGF